MTIYNKIVIMIEKELLENLILEQNESYSSIGRQFGITGNAVKKQAKRLGIKLPQRRVVNENEKFSHPHKNTSNISYVSSVSDELFIEYVQTSNSWNELRIKFGYKSKCLTPKLRDEIIERCSTLGMELKFRESDFIGGKTKGELFKERKNWQSARSAIRKNAQKNFFEKNPNPVCSICGYSHHIEVAHIKAVADFDDNTPVSEINSIENLIALCPNHHWEYDNGILTL